VLEYIDLIKYFLQKNMNIAYAANINTEEISGETAGELTKLFQMVISKIPLWIAAVIVMLISIFIAKIVTNIIEGKVADKMEDDHQEIQILVGRMTYFTILIIGITVSFKIAGIDITSIVAAIALGVGFALKDLIMNFLSGVMILLGNHFSIGDFINIGGTMGKVIEIQSRVTILQGIDGTKVIVPNADLFKKQVISYTSNPFRRIEIIVGVTYNSNLENVIKVIMDTLKNTKGVLASPKPAVLVSDFAEHSVSLKVRAWTESRGGWLQVKSRLIIALKKTFAEYDIQIPFPIRTIVYDKENPHHEKIMQKKKDLEIIDPSNVVQNNIPNVDPNLLAQVPAQSSNNS